MIAVPETKEELLHELYAAFSRIDKLERTIDSLEEELHDLLTNDTHNAEPTLQAHSDNNV